MKVITIHSKKNGVKDILVDDDDYELVSKYRWCIAFTRGSFYAVNTTYVNRKPINIKMHRLIMGLLDNPKILIDHKDNNGLNNCRSNLRITDQAKNACNTKFTSKSNSGFRGVYKYNKENMNRMYGVYVRHERKRIFGGYFSEPIEAAKKYNELALKYHGEFAKLNQFNPQ